MSLNDHTRRTLGGALLSLVLLVGALWWGYGALSTPDPLTAVAVRAEILDGGLPRANAVFEADAVTHACSSEPACLAGALLAYMLLAEAHVPGSPAVPDVIDSFLVDPTVNQVIYVDGPGAPSHMAIPTDLGLAVTTAEFGRVSLGRLRLFDGKDFDFSADWRIDHAAWPDDALSLSAELLADVRRVYRGYSAKVNWALAERDHRLRRKAEAVRRELGVERPQG